MLPGDFYDFSNGMDLKHLAKMSRVLHRRKRPFTVPQQSENSLGFFLLSHSDDAHETVYRSIFVLDG